MCKSSEAISFLFYQSSSSFTTSVFRSKQDVGVVSSFPAADHLSTGGLLAHEGTWGCNSSSPLHVKLEFLPSNVANGWNYGVLLIQLDRNLCTFPHSVANDTKRKDI